MDVVITTSDPTALDAEEIAEALEDLDYFVASVRILERGTGVETGKWEI